MRHFRKLKKGFLDDLSSYINTYMSMHGSEHNAVVEEAYKAIDEYYDESRAFNTAGGFIPDECTTVPMAAPMPAQTEASRKRRKASEQRNFSLGLRRAEDTGAIVLPEKQPTFQQNLFAIIDSRGVKDSYVYKKADIDRRLFSKIRADIDYHPSKSTAVKLCLALGLNISDTERLLETAGYCLSLSDTADLVVRYCIEHRNYNLIEVNEALDYFGEDIL